MPRAVTYLDKDVIKNIKELYQDSNQPLSTIIAELIDIGYKVKKHHESQETQVSKSDSMGAEEGKTIVIEKHTEYLLRIMAMVADSYRCVRNERSKYNEKHVEEALTKITSNAQNYVSEKLGKN